MRIAARSLMARFAVSAAAFLIGAGGMTGAITAPPTPPTGDASSRHIYPLVAPPAGASVPRITVDVSDAPDAAAWADTARSLGRQWFPLLCQLLATERYTWPREIRLVFKKELRVPAYASGSEITISARWIREHPEDFGVIIHEMVHLIQAYPASRNKPGWLVEGIADYIRWWRYEPEATRSRIDPAKASYRDSYRTTAAFLAWVSARYDRRLVPRLDRALREGAYRDGLFQEVTGKPLDTLWAEFLAAQPQPQQRR